MRKIIFYFPYKGIGGVSLLFQRLSGFLAKDRDVFLVDFRDGFMGKLVPDGVNFIDFELVSKYPENAILVIQSVAPWNIRDLHKFPPDTRVLFWTLHPLNLYPFIFSLETSNYLKALIAHLLLPISFFRKRKMAKIVRYLVSRNSLIFMDGENYNTTAKFFSDTKIQKRLLPIFSTPGRIMDRAPGNVLRCCWIGRVVDFKVHILLHLIERLNAAVSKIGPIEMIVVGDGEALEYLKKGLKKIHAVQVKFLQNVPPVELDSFLNGNVDVLFAMGTSALEGASRAIPTFLLDYSFKPIKGIYRFRYLFDADDYSLAEEINTSHYEDVSSLEDNLLNLRSNFNAIGMKGYEYWQLHFSPQAILKEFPKYEASATATISEMKELGFLKADILSRSIKSGVRKFKKNIPSVHGFGET